MWFVCVALFVCFCIRKWGISDVTLPRLTLGLQFKLQRSSPGRPFCGPQSLGPGIDVCNGVARQQRYLAITGWKGVKALNQFQATLSSEGRQGWGVFCCLLRVYVNHMA